jgi:hypothetical protein
MPMSESLADRMMMWFRGDGTAVRFAIDIWAVARVLDELVGKNREVSGDEVTDTFRRLMYDIPTNPFYAAHAHELAPVMNDMMLRWQVANKLELDQMDGDLPKAWMLRAGIYQVFVYVASLAVDPEWAVAVGPEIWRTYSTTLEEYVKEVN